MTIILCGIKHCGKSTLGKALAADTGVPFFDLDDLIPLEGYDSVRELYRQGGKEIFQNRELSALKTFLLSRNKADAILSLGGGTLDNPQARQMVLDSTPPLTLIYLKEEAPLLFERICRSGIPPFLKGASPVEEFYALYHRRDKLYTETASHTIELEGQPVEACLAKLRALVLPLITTPKTQGDPSL